MELHEITYVDVDGNYLTMCSAGGDFWYINNGNGSDMLSFPDWCRYMIKWLDSHKSLTIIP
jgi:hypothetical protein